MSLLRSLLPLFLAITSVLAYAQLSNNSLLNLPSPGNDFDIRNGAILAPILRPRVPGTPGIEEVRRHFVTFFEKNLPNWRISYQNSTQNTALRKRIFFSNLIMSRDPPWAKPGDVGRLTLVAHYDSKISPKGFIGATDSAAPCAMMMHAARSIDEALTKKWAAMQQSGRPAQQTEKGIQLIFLDGEEAFIEWSDSDSVYGARSLADTWDKQFHPAMSVYRNELSSISLFLLLDLLGTAQPNVPSYFPTTHWAYQNMARIESRLRTLRQMRSSPNYINKQVSRPTAEKMWLSEGRKAANAGWLGGMIEDDHIPFMRKGVETLHIIPNPFPWVWHRAEDDGPHLDIPTVQDWAQIVAAFSAEWMELEGYMPASGPAQGQERAPHMERSDASLEENSWEEENIWERDELSQ